MAKREFIDKQELDIKIGDILSLLDGVSTITEQEVVKPYLTKLRANIISSIEDIKGTYDNTTPEHDRPLCKCARNEVRLEIIDLINNLLSEQEVQEDGNVN